MKLLLLGISLSIVGFGTLLQAEEGDHKPGSPRPRLEDGRIIESPSIAEEIFFWVNPIPYLLGKAVQAVCNGICESDEDKKASNKQNATFVENAQRCNEDLQNQIQTQWQNNPERGDHPELSNHLQRAIRKLLSLLRGIQTGLPPKIEKTDQMLNPLPFQAPPKKTPPQLFSAELRQKIQDRIADFLQDNSEGETPAKRKVAELILDNLSQGCEPNTQPLAELILNALRNQAQKKNRVNSQSAPPAPGSE